MLLIAHIYHISTIHKVITVYGNDIGTYQRTYTVLPTTIYMV